ncbi:MAG: hypothetical protein LJE85_14705 [Gammaproteobacteria bacterium]|jgi:hypothetical protein|nr:hypothetical protein [Gammaproteobacteria bacterium]
MMKIAYISLFLLFFAGCSSDNDATSQQQVADGTNQAVNDPYYQLQESEAKKHKDSAPASGAGTSNSK